MVSYNGLILPLLQLFCVAFCYGTPINKNPGNSSAARPPVVLIPGDLGNQLEAKLDKPSVVHYICYKKTNDYFTLWLNMELLVPVAIDCWIDNMRLIYNWRKRRTEAPPGVNVRVPGFGKTYPLEYLDPSKQSVGMYFFTIAQALADWGYTRDDDLRGAPYDWRKAPNENKPYFLALQQMIEEMAHKAGGPVELRLLGGPGGVAKTLRVMASGDNNRIPLISSLKIRAQQRTAVSTPWLLPYGSVWPADKVLVFTPNENYTLGDYQRFFSDIAFEEGWAMRHDTEPLVNVLEPPGVPVHCLYGTGVDTPEAFHYGAGFPDVEPAVDYGDGDGR
ncbi:hypothetical protein ANANG_G00208560 [Anguilla anguilla]|uniref:Uncharacterized protein n=1 Tax=Anguilla anguilla TaxID=7936 RepID=A0A9D3LZD8_ANGAN|nr:hypothetical protein ANANG_G00208560 [Anguilla anguilla]